MSIPVKSAPVAARKFHTRIPNSTFIVQRLDAEGKAVAGQVRILPFHGTELTTTDAEAIAQLDACIDDGNSTTIYRDGEMSLSLGDEQAPFHDVKKRAGEIVEQIAKAGQRA